MNKIREWLIRQLGGYTQGDLAFRDARITLLQRQAVTPQKFRVAYVYYDEISGNPSNWQAREHAREAVAVKIGQQLMEDGMIQVHWAVEPNQDGRPIKRMRITGTAWVVRPGDMIEPRVHHWTAKEAGGKEQRDE